METEYKIRITDLENAVTSLKSDFEEYFSDLEKGNVVFSRVSLHSKKLNKYNIQLSKVKSKRLNLKNGDVVLIQKPLQK